MTIGPVFLCLLVIIIGAQDQSGPMFLNLPYSYSISENLKINTIIGTVRATDVNPNDESSISFDIPATSDRYGFVRVGPTRILSNNQYEADLLTTYKLDFEMAQFYRFKVRATRYIRRQATLSSSDTEVLLHVKDIDDNKPVFSSLKYSFSMNVEESPGSTVSGPTIFIDDKDSYANARYSVYLDGNDGSTFDVLPKEGAQKTEVSLLAQKPELLRTRLGQRLQFKIFAESPGQRVKTSAEIEVTLTTNVNKPPYFNFSDFTTTVFEDFPSGRKILTSLKAVDPEGQALTYRLITEDSNIKSKFRVDPNNGDVTLISKLKFADASSYNFLVSASDPKGGERSVPVWVLVRNPKEGYPVFANAKVTSEVKERDTNLQPVMNFDARLPSDASVLYKIISGNVRNAFAIDGDTGDVSMNSPVSISDATLVESEFVITLKIGAYPKDDESKTSFAEGQVIVRDINDNAPKFERIRYNVTVAETVSIGSVILRVAAYDNDTGSNAIIDYQVVSGAKGDFDVDVSNGDFKTIRALDADRSSKYSVVVSAKDRGSPSLNSSVTVDISVGDINNKPPVFSNTSYVEFLSHDTVPGAKILQVLATDPDGSAVLKYSISGENFTIRDALGFEVIETRWAPSKIFDIDDVTGEITLDKNLHRETTAEYNFEVKVEDLKAASGRQISSARVSVFVLGSDELVFMPPWTPFDPFYDFAVNENLAIGTLVGKVIAIDPTTRRTASSFGMLENDDGYLSLNNDTGEIRMAKEVDHEALGTKSISTKIKAEAFGKSALATVRIAVVDQNDEKPEFQCPDGQKPCEEIVMSVAEDSSPMTKIGRVRAVDRDWGEFGKKRFFLSGLGSEAFALNNATGELFVAPNATIDREQMSTYEFVVTAMDNPTGQQHHYSKVKLIVNVTDVNDNAPLFTLSEYEFEVYDDVSIGFEIGRAIANDADLGASAEVYYLLQNIDSGLRDLITLTRTNGAILTKFYLESKARSDPYRLIIRAFDKGSPNRFSTTTAKLFIRLSPYRQIGSPKILEPVLDNMVFEIDEEPPIGSNLIRVVAFDQSETKDLPIFFSLLESAAYPGVEKFSIDQNSGWIRVADRLDYEGQKEFTVVAVVSSPTLGESERVFQIKLNDLDDNRPRFGVCDGVYIGSMEAHVKENLSPETVVAQPKACDLDAAPFNGTFYFITCGNDDELFAIDNETGIITTTRSLDREKASFHLLCITASNNSIVPYDKDDSLQLSVIVDDDPTDNRLMSKSTFVAGLVTPTAVGKPILRLDAADSSLKYQSLRYKIRRSEFVQNRGRKSSNANGYFTIDEQTGVLKANRESYVSGNGHFLVEVVVEDMVTQKTEVVNVKLFNVNSEDLIQFVFSEKPNSIYNKFPQFIEIVEDSTDSSIQPLYYRHHLEKRNVQFTMTDVCFYVLKNGLIMNSAAALKLLNTDNPKLERARADYGVQHVDKCFLVPAAVKTYPTIMVDSVLRFWLWLLLVISGIIIFIACVIAIIFLYCCWYRYRRYEKIAETSSRFDDSANTIRKEYEWQSSSLPVGSKVPLDKEYEWHSSTMNVNMTNGSVHHSSTAGSERRY